MRFGGRHPDIADTRCIAFRKSIWENHFSGLYRTLDAKVDRHFEHIVLEVVDQNASESGWVEGFSHPPLILGKQGHVKRVGPFVVPKCVEWVYLLVQYGYQSRMAHQA